MCNMIWLRNFVNDDAEEFQRKQGSNIPLDEIREMFTKWNKKVHEGDYFEVFAVMRDDELAGMISLYQLSRSVVSCGPEVFDNYRKQGVGREAMLLAMDAAKSMGYKIVSQQIGRNNAASIALHSSLGFETDGYVYRNRKGNEVLIYLRSLCD